MKSLMAGIGLLLASQVGIAYTVRAECLGLEADMQNINLLTEEYPPISFLGKDGRPAGLAVEVVDEIQRRLGTQKTIQIKPWARAYREANLVGNTILFSVAHTEMRQPLFQWVGPIFRMTGSFYTRKHSEITFHNLDDLHRLDRIGTVRDSFEDQLLKQKGFSNLEPSVSQARNLKKLISGRVDVVAATNLTIAQFSKIAGVPMSDIKANFNFIEVDNYIVFSKDIAPNIVECWSNTFDDIKNDGTLRRIKDKWLDDSRIRDGSSSD